MISIFGYVLLTKPEYAYLLHRERQKGNSEGFKIGRDWGRWMNWEPRDANIPSLQEVTSDMKDRANKLKSLTIPYEFISAFEGDDDARL